MRGKKNLHHCICYTVDYSILIVTLYMYVIKEYSSVNINDYHILADSGETILHILIKKAKNCRHYISQ